MGRTHIWLFPGIACLPSYKNLNHSCFISLSCSQRILSLHWPPSCNLLLFDFRVETSISGGSFMFLPHFCPPKTKYCQAPCSSYKDVSTKVSLTFLFTTPWESSTARNSRKVYFYVHLCNMRQQNLICRHV